jgi:hypothetical protein
MSGEVPIDLERQFLARLNHADLQVAAQFSWVNMGKPWETLNGCRRGAAGMLPLGHGQAAALHAWLLLSGHRSLLRKRLQVRQD